MNEELDERGVEVFGHEPKAERSAGITAASEHEIG